MSARRGARVSTGPSFPCPRCGRPVARTRRGRPRVIACARCRYLLHDYPRPCAGFVVLRNEDVLLLRRGSEPRRGRIDLPGGFIEAGEEIEAAARRELVEETGLTATRVEPLGTWWDRYHLRGFGWFPTMNFYFLGRSARGTPKAADDAASAEWRPLATVMRLREEFAWAHMASVFEAVRRRVR